MGGVPAPLKLNAHRFSATPTIVYFHPVLSLSWPKSACSRIFLLATMLPGLLRLVPANRVKNLTFLTLWVTRL